MFGIGYTSDELVGPLYFVSPLLVPVVLLFVNALVYLTYINNWFYVKKDRVGQVSGIIAKNTHEILLSKVESVHVKQDIFGRLLNFGTLVLVGTGGTPHYMRCILRNHKAKWQIDPCQKSFSRLFLGSI